MFTLRHRIVRAVQRIGTRRAAVMTAVVGLSMIAAVVGSPAMARSVERFQAQVIGAPARVTALVSAALNGGPLSATKEDTLIIDTDGDGNADPGDTIRYEVQIASTPGHTGVEFSDTLDPNTTLVGGSVNVSPLALDDSYDTIGNTLLKVGVAAGSDPEVVVAGGSIFDNDTEFLGDTFTLKSVEGVNFVAVSVTAATEQGGSVTVNANGSFSYTPPVGFTGTDNFDYVITDDGVGGLNPLTGPGRVTLNVTQKVWYVNNNAVAGGMGRSTDPFDTLVEAQTASAAGDTIYVFEGDGTTGGQNSGIVLKNLQRLVGEGVALTMPVSVNGGPNPTTLRAAGTKPRVGNSAGNGVAATDAIPIEIVGLSLSGSANAIDLTLTGAFAGTGTLAIKSNTIFSAGAEGIDINMGGTGTLTLDVQTNTWTTTAASHVGNAFDARRTLGALRVAFSNNTNVTSTATGVFIDGAAGGAASTHVTALSSNTVHQNTGGTGMNIANATFDAIPGGSFNQVAGGTTTVGVAGNGVGGAGIVMTTVSGDLSFTDLDIVADGGAGLQVTGTGAIAASTGTLVSVGSGVATLAATGGPAVDISMATVNLPLLSLTSSNSASTGVRLNNVLNGTTAALFSAGSGSAITNATGTDFSITGGNATVTYNGTITDDVGQLVLVSGNTGGIKTFGGAITDGDDGDGSGISLTGNMGATIRFQGGLVLSTGANPAFAATGGGTVEVCDESPCNPAATGALINKVTTTTGTALNVASTMIGANNLEFRSISAGTAATGPTNGIVLNTTGSSGGLKVKGTGNTTQGGDASGGLIQKTSGSGISLKSTRNVSLVNMTIQNTLASGIAGEQVTNFTFDNGTVTGSGDATQESNIAFNGCDDGVSCLLGNHVNGVVIVTDSILNTAFDSGLDIQNNDGTISMLTVTNNSLTSTTLDATSKGTAILVNLTGNASTVGNLMNASIANNNISNFPSSAGIQVIGGNTHATGPAGFVGDPTSGTDTINITGNLIAGPSSSNRMGTSAIVVSLNGGNSGQRSQGNFNVSNNGTVANPLTNMDGTSILAGNNGYVDGTYVMDNNVIVANNIFGSQGIGGGNGIVVSNAETPLMNWTITNNTISNTDGNGILAVGRGVSGQLNVGIRGNAVGAPLAGVRPGIRVDAGNASSGDDAVCTEIANNTSGGSGGHAGIGIRKQGTLAATNDFGIEGLVPSPASCGQAEDRVSSQNTGAVATGTDCDGNAGSKTLAISGSNFVSCSSAP